MPPKKKFFWAALFSGSIIMMPPSCASASTCSTPARQPCQPGGQAPRTLTSASVEAAARKAVPGIIFRSGKWPVKYCSLALMHLYPTAYFCGSSSTTLSTSRNGYLQAGGNITSI